MTIDSDCIRSVLVGSLFLLPEIIRNMDHYNFGMFINQAVIKNQLQKPGDASMCDSGGIYT